MEQKRDLRGGHDTAPGAGDSRLLYSAAARQEGTAFFGKEKRENEPSLLEAEKGTGVRSRCRGLSVYPNVSMAAEWSMRELRAKFQRPIGRPR